MSPDLKKNRPERGGPRGFTLAELLTVVAILSVLAAIAIPIFTQAHERAERAAELANVRTLKTLAVEAILTGGLHSNTGWYVSAAIDRMGNITNFTLHPMGKADELLEDGFEIERYGGVTYYLLYLKSLDLSA